MNLKQAADESIKRTFDYFETKEDGSRKAEVVMIRSAVSNALSEYINQTTIAKHVSKDRTTVLHYLRSHTGNLIHWGGYQETYLIAKEITAATMAATVRTKKTSVIEMRIKSLRRQITDLELEKISLIDGEPTPFFNSK